MYKEYNTLVEFCTNGTVSIDYAIWGLSDSYNTV